MKLYKLNFPHFVWQKTCQSYKVEQTILWLKEQKQHIFSTQRESRKNSAADSM